MKRFRMQQSALALLPWLVTAAVGAGCGGPTVVCGTGTKLDKASGECRAVASGPDLNAIIDDFSLGDFSFSDVDVPEQMQRGFPENRTFTIANTGDTTQAATIVRVSLVPVDAVIGEVQDAIDSIGIEDTCEDDGDCSAPTYCAPSRLNDTSDESLVCKLETRSIGSVIIQDLAPGEARSINYELALPRDFDDEGLYGLLFSVNEVALIRDPASTEDEPVYIEDPDHPLGLNDPLERAAALHAAATVIVGTPDKPNLRVLSSEISEQSFSINDFGVPMANVSALLSAQGKSITAATHVRFELFIPGHVVDVPGQDLGEQYFTDHALDFDAAPEQTSYTLDEARTFPLWIDNSGTLNTEYVIEPTCPQAECETEIAIENDVGVDIAADLHLSVFDRKLLAMTAAKPELNPNLDTDNLELPGIVRMVVSTDEDEYENDDGQLLADNIAEFDVVFLAPSHEREAADDDTADIADVEQEQAPQVLGPGPYANNDALTPTWAWSVGNDWFGAEAQIKNESSKAFLYNALVAQDVRSDNFVRLKAFTLGFDIVNVSGSFDWGTMRTMAQNRATGRLTLFGATYLDLNYVPSLQCTTEDNFEACMVFAVEFRPRKNEGSPTKSPRQKKKVYLNWERERKFYFAIGPVPFEVAIGLSAGVGMRATIAFTQDRSLNDADGSAATTGLQVSLGPVADVAGSVFGGVSVDVLKAGIQGSLTFLGLEFLPSVLVGQTQVLDELRSCWGANSGEARFEGPLTLKALEGDIKVVVLYDIWIASGELWSMTLMSFPPAWTRTWNLFGPYSVYFNPSTGLCQEVFAPSAWMSPRPCTSVLGGPGYCNRSGGRGNYQVAFPITSGCRTMKIDAWLEPVYDKLQVFPIEAWDRFDGSAAAFTPDNGKYGDIAGSADNENSLAVLGQGAADAYPAYVRTFDTGWSLLGGELVNIDVGNTVDQMWGTNAANQIFRRNGNSWQLMPGAAIDITVSSANRVWIAGTDFNLYEFDGANSWTMLGAPPTGGGIKRLDADPSGGVWVVANDGTIWNRNYADNNWYPVPGLAVDIGVSASPSGLHYGQVWVLGVGAFRGGYQLFRLKDDLTWEAQGYLGGVRVSGLGYGGAAVIDSSGGIWKVKRPFANSPSLVLSGWNPTNYHTFCAPGAMVRLVSDTEVTYPGASIATY